MARAPISISDVSLYVARPTGRLQGRQSRQHRFRLREQKTAAAQISDLRRRCGGNAGREIA